MRVFFYTLGCKVNQYETQAMRRLMEEEGYETAEYTPGKQMSGDAVIVVNSCTVTGESDHKLRKLLRRCRRENPQAVLVLTGCMPQAFPEQAAALTEADIVLGNAARSSLPAQVRRFLTLGQRIVEIPPHGGKFESLSIGEFQGRTRAFVKIEDGCNRFCSYCIIPYARGRVRSKPPEELEREIRALAEKGYGEMVLVGINLTAYGQEWGQTIADAVDTACAVEGVRRIRLGSLEPDALDEATIARLAARPALCPQFHLSLQSGCDATLRRMNRRYDTAGYAAVCAALRRAFPGCALTTDVMVGFPGEDEEEFRRSLAFVEEIGFAKVHVFAYSQRPGTPAAAAPGQVPEEEKAARSRRMIAACAHSREAFLDGQIGRTLEVLLETRGEKGCAEGYAADYTPVRVPVEAFEPGDILSVRIVGREGDTCLGAAE